MKNICLAMILMALISMSGFAQQGFSLGAAYNAQTIKYPGFIVKAEYEKFFSDDLSLPLSLNVGFSNHQTHNVMTAELERGHRKYIGDIYVEQAFGLGMMVSFYQAEIWQELDNGSVNYVRGGPGIDIMPSVVLGAGWKISKNGSLWLRNKIAFPIPTRELSKPYIGFQIGYTHLLKSF